MEKGRKRSAGKKFLCIALVLGAAVSGCSARSGGRETRSIDAALDEKTVMEISGQPVVKAEYQMTLKNYDAGIKGKYTTEEANQEDFWTMDSEEGRPLDQLMELVQEDLVHKKIVAKLAKEAGIKQETDFAAIAEQAETENNEREGMSLAGNVVYGPASYRLEDYYSYAYTAAEAELMECLKKQYQVTEEELKQIYQANLEQYTSEASVRMLVAETKAGAKLEQAQQVAAELEKETDPKSLSGRYPDVAFYEITLSSLNKEEGKTGAYMQRWEIASSMEDGEICEPFLNGERWMVMRCLQREEQAAEAFGEVKGTLENEVRSQMAREEIEKNIQEAKVTCEEEMLEQIALETLQD